MIELFLTPETSGYTALAQIPYLIVGLGNPGREYRNNRHNIGFMVLDQLAKELNLSFGRVEHKSVVAKGSYQNQPIILAKPQTYMNLSGGAVCSLLRYYRIPLNRLLVVFDDVDLPWETMRLRPAGGSGGHKGVQSIIQALGSEDFPRLRLGIGRPPGRRQAAHYVLKDFSPTEEEALAFVLQKAVQAILTFVTQGLETAMNRFNSSNTEP